MRKWLIVLGLALLTAFVMRRARRHEPERVHGQVRSPAAAAVTAATEPADEARQGFLYGRVTMRGGAVHEGRLRWGDGDQEAFWGDTFNGAKKENPWIAQVPAGRLPKERDPIEIFGIPLGRREKKLEVSRLFMARFGDLARIESIGRDVRVTLKGGTVFDLDRLEASDFDDGVRVWDAQGGSVDLDSSLIRTIELLPAGGLAAVPARLHGTVKTPVGDFTGFLQWDRNDCVGTDELVGRAASGEVRLRYDTLRSIARRSSDGSRVTLLDGRELDLEGTREAGDGNRGVYVDDVRYGRVLVSWKAFERVDFSPAGSGPAYGDFGPEVALRGKVTTRDGGSFAGRLVFDLDESVTVETLDAPSQGVDYTIPFGLVASIGLPGPTESDQRATVKLHEGEELRLERSGDLGKGNAGLLIFVDGRPSPEYVPWIDAARIEFERAQAK